MVHNLNTLKKIDTGQIKDRNGKIDPQNPIPDQVLTKRSKNQQSNQGLGKNKDQQNDNNTTKTLLQQDKIVDDGYISNETLVHSNITKLDTQNNEIQQKMDKSQEMYEENDK